MDEKIIRFFDVEMRASEDEDMKAEGYALKFDKETIIGGKKWGWREKISKTALDGAQLDDVVFTFNHSFDNVLARTTNKSLKLTVDSVGLKISAKIVDTAIGRDVYKLIKEELINRMSFMAMVASSKWTWADPKSDDMDLKEITGFSKFYDVSAVTFPAYKDTSIAVRNEELAQRQQQVRERQLERLNKLLGGK